MHTNRRNELKLCLDPFKVCLHNKLVNEKRNKKCAECFTNDKIALEIPLCHIVRYATVWTPNSR